MVKNCHTIVGVNKEKEYEILLEQGTYEILVTAEGYLPYVIYTRVQPNQSEYMDVELVKIPDDYKIINKKVEGNIVNALNGLAIDSVSVKIRKGWNNTPRDLDSHLSYYVYGDMQTDDYATAENRKMHVYYSNKAGYYDGNNVAVLDKDETHGYGPETTTITIFMTKKMMEEGFFRYSVHNFSGEYDSKGLSLSKAVVRVYAGNNLVKTINVPTDGEGNVWNVFDMNFAGINILNSFDYTLSPEGVY